MGVAGAAALSNVSGLSGVSCASGVQSVPVWPLFEVPRRWKSRGRKLPAEYRGEYLPRVDVAELAQHRASPLVSSAPLPAPHDPAASAECVLAG